MAKVSGDTGQWVFWCPGCNMAHVIDDRWEFDGNLESPTFSPSLLCYENSASPRCHSFIRAGRIEFLGDSNHSLANQTVDIPEWLGFRGPKG